VFACPYWKRREIITPALRVFGRRLCAAQRGSATSCDRSPPDFEPVGEVDGVTRGIDGTLATDAAWYRSGMFNEHYRPAGIDHYLLTYRYVPELGLIHYVVLFKDLRASRFTERDRTIAHYVHRELGETWKAARKAVLRAGFVRRSIGSSAAPAKKKWRTGSVSVHRRCIPTASFCTSVSAYEAEASFSRTRECGRAPLVSCSRTPTSRALSDQTCGRHDEAFVGVGFLFRSFHEFSSAQVGGNWSPCDV
jgi:hypothetical protein